MRCTCASSPERSLHDQGIHQGGNSRFLLLFLFSSAGKKRQRVSFPAIYFVPSAISTLKVRGDSFFPPPFLCLLYFGRKPSGREQNEILTWQSSGVTATSVATDGNCYAALFLSFTLALVSLANASKNNGFASCLSSLTPESLVASGVATTSWTCSIQANQSQV